MTLNLAQGLTLQYRIDRPVIISCSEGSLWLTQPETGQDIIIETGECHVFHSPQRTHCGGPIVIEALQDSQIKIARLSACSAK